MLEKVSFLFTLVCSIWGISNLIWFIRSIVSHCMFSKILKIHNNVVSSVFKNIVCISVVSQLQLERGLIKYMLFKMPPSLLQCFHFKEDEKEKKLFLSSEVTQKLSTSVPWRQQFNPCQAYQGRSFQKLLEETFPSIPLNFKLRHCQWKHLCWLT